MDITRPRQLTFWTALTCAVALVAALVTLPIWGIPVWLALRDNPD